mmetsp:Transcript_105192/g.166012  ORF Transcript_105192/g.166012 Transcript_105192/m.166012 type:complete len:97 (-) Transcript_105192:24-314(-)
MADASFICVLVIFVVVYIFVISAFTGLNPVVFLNKLMPFGLHVPQNASELVEALLTPSFWRCLSVGGLLSYFIPAAMRSFRRRRLSDSSDAREKIE